VRYRNWYWMVAFELLVYDVEALGLKTKHKLIRDLQSCVQKIYFFRKKYLRLMKNGFECYYR
jgi:hypothetical protein